MPKADLKTSLQTLMVPELTTYDSLLNCETE